METQAIKYKSAAELHHENRALMNALKNRDRLLGAVGVGYFIIFMVFVLWGITNQCFGADITPAEARAAAASQKIDLKIPADVRVSVFNTMPVNLVIEYAAPEKSAIPKNYDKSQRKARLNSIYQQKSDAIISRILSADSTLVHRYDNIPMMVIRVNTRNALLYILNDPDVISAMPDASFKTELIESNPMVSQSVPIAAGARGGVTVAVIDTGLFQTSTLAKSGRVIKQIDATGANNLQDYNGHGTFIATVIANVAPASRFITIKAGGVSLTNGTLSFVAVANGINWLIENSATYPVSVVNLSLSSASYFPGDCVSTFSGLISDLADFNIVAVAASGNGGRKTSMPEPACSRDALSVGAVYDVVQPLWTAPSGGSISCNDYNTVPGTVACWSNASLALDVYAPGCLISVTGLPSKCGTSAAAAVTSGVIALARSSYTSNPPDARQIIDMARFQTTNYLTDTRNGIRRPMINAGYMMQKISSYVPPAYYTPTPSPLPTVFPPPKNPPSYNGPPTGATS